MTLPPIDYSEYKKREMQGQLPQVIRGRMKLPCLPLFLPFRPSGPPSLPRILSHSVSLCASPWCCLSLTHTHAHFSFSHSLSSSPFPRSPVLSVETQ